MPFNPFSALTSKIFGALAIAMLTFAVVQTVRIEGLTIWPLKIEGYAAANARLKADLEAVLVAQLQARQAQDAADLETAARYRALAKESENEHREAVAVVQSAADRYAGAHRVRPCPAASGASGPGPAGVPDNPAPSDSASGDAGMVAVTRPDFDKLTNGPPLQAAERGWFLQSLIDAGYAVVGD